MYLIPKNVSGKMEIMPGFGIKEAIITVIVAALVFGMLTGISLIFQKDTYTDAAGKTYDADEGQWHMEKNPQLGVTVTKGPGIGTLTRVSITLAFTILAAAFVSPGTFGMLEIYGPSMSLADAMLIRMKWSKKNKLNKNIYIHHYQEFGED